MDSNPVRSTTADTARSSSVDKLQEMLANHVSGMNRRLRDSVGSAYQAGDDFAQLLRHEAVQYKTNAENLLNRFTPPPWSFEQVSQITRQLWVHDFRLRWELEKHTVTFQTLIDTLAEEEARKIRVVVKMLEAEDMSSAPRLLGDLVGKEHPHYVLFMLAGLYKWTEEDKPSIALRYLERAATIPIPDREEHYHRIANLAVASVHQSREHHTNALQALQRIPDLDQEDPMALYALV
ncbi:hypothetical protein GF324_01030, partial [bacterium]|nr:hypothetical protein [bacterium]